MQNNKKYFILQNSALLKTRTAFRSTDLLQFHAITSPQDPTPEGPEISHQLPPLARICAPVKALSAARILAIYSRSFDHLIST